MSEVKYQIDTSVDNDHIEIGIEPRFNSHDASLHTRGPRHEPKRCRWIFGSPYVLGASILLSLGGFTYGYEQTLVTISNVMPQFHRAFPETDPTSPAASFHIGLATAMIPLGAFVGSFFVPTLLDRCSRKWALTIVVIIYDVGAIVQTTAPNYIALVCGRFVGGLGAGALAIVSCRSSYIGTLLKTQGAPLYISEISPPTLRGALLVLQCSSIIVGANAAFWITYGARNVDGSASFRLPFGLRVVSKSAIRRCSDLTPSLQDLCEHCWYTDPPVP